MMFNDLLSSDPLPGVQTTFATNDGGQPNYSSVFGYCDSFNGENMYVLTGTVGASALMKNLYRYDKITNLWTDLGAIPTEMGSNTYWSIVAIDDDTLIAILRNICYAYSISTNTWSARAAPANGSQSMYGVKSHYYNGKVYRFGPSATTNINYVNVYDPVTNTHTTLKTDAVTSGAYSGSIIFEGKIYLFSNYGTSSNTTIRIYDIATDVISSLPAPGYGTTMTTLVVKGNYIYLFATDKDTYRNVMRFNPADGTSVAMTPLSRSFNMGYVTVYDGKALLYGGRNAATTTYWTDFLSYTI